MKNQLCKIFTVISFTFVTPRAVAAACSEQETFTLVVHGGAGSWQISGAQEAVIRRKITEVLNEGYSLLAGGSTAIDAVQKAVQIMEDSGILNAGKGAVRNRDNIVELDASIMNGKTLKAGAVAAVKTIKNPVAAARAVMDKSTHVMLASPGAESFAAAQGVEIVDPSYFNNLLEEPRLLTHEYGTVGAVALDRCGDLAAATSTGGLKGKLPGRVGDSPIIGAGTYASNATAAISATGQGEYFIRLSVSRDIAALMEYKGLSLAQAADEVVREKLHALGGTGGVISLDRAGNVAMPFNTRAMLRGVVRQNHEIFIAFDP